MSKMDDRLAILEASKKRVSAINRGDPVTNVCAGEDGRHGVFMEYKVKSRKNRYGIVHREYLARVKYSGHTGNTDIQVIYPGHLTGEKCKELFDPIWESEYG